MSIVSEEQTAYVRGPCTRQAEVHRCEENQVFTTKLELLPPTDRQVQDLRNVKCFQSFPLGGGFHRSAHPSSKFIGGDGE